MSAQQPHPTRSAPTGPLDGITVVSLEQAVAAPFATRQLADLGARVIKVERPGKGDFARDYDETVGGDSSYFVWLNRSKESIALDVKHPDGHAVLRELVGKADVFVQNLAPGASARLGMDAQSLHDWHPSVIVCDISGYDPDSEWAERKAYDLLVQAETGLVELTGDDGVIAKVGISIADIAAGMYAYSGILSALLQRQQTGVGTTVSVSLFAAMSEWLAAPMHYARGGSLPQRVGARHATIAPYGPFPSKDGGVILLAIQNEAEWKRLCEVFLHDPALADDPRFAGNAARVQNRDQLEPIIEAVTRRRSAEENLQLLDAASIANGRSGSVTDLPDHLGFGSGRWRETRSPGGSFPSMTPPAQVEGIRPRWDPVPALGAHTDAILAELGRSSEAVAGLRVASAI